MPTVPRPRARVRPPASPARFHALRLHPGDDLLTGLQQAARQLGLRAAFVAACVGSATRVSLRYANRERASVRQGHFELVSLSGTLDAATAHLHASFADGTGRVFGGHLLAGTRVYTTAEIVIGELTRLRFSREHDATYGYDELVVRRR